MRIPSTLLRNTGTLKPVTVTGLGPSFGTPVTVACNWTENTGVAGRGNAGAVTVLLKPDIPVTVGDRFECEAGVFTVTRVTVHRGPLGPAYIEVTAA